MREVCHDVNIEPPLQPLSHSKHHSPGNTSDNARLDISALGFWSRNEKTFFDIRVTHPNSPSYHSKSLEAICELHENEKKNAYNDRVLNIEKASFCPLVFTTSGGMAPECAKVNKRLAEMIAQKRREPYHIVINHVRTKLRFALLRSTLAALRGFRGGRSDRDVHELRDTDIGLIPASASYDV